MNVIAQAMMPDAAHSAQAGKSSHRPGRGPGHRPGPGPAWLHPGWSWTIRQNWVISFFSVSFTLIVGAVLGALPTLIAGSWHDAQTRIQTWVLTGLAVLGVAAGLAGAFLHRKRLLILRRHGTAYVLQEISEGWARDQADAFRAAAERYFARKIDVPGPGRLGEAWAWPLDGGALRWDIKLDALVRDFRVLHADDDPATPNGILMWAWWAVALAFGLRATAGDRGLTLDVWQRPGRGRAGEVEPEPWWQAQPHRFGNSDPPPLASLLPQSRPRELTRPVRFEVRALGDANRQEQASDISVLLIRLGWQSWGPLPEVNSEHGQPIDLSFTVHDAAAVAVPGIYQTHLHEFRCIPAGERERFPWAAFPSLVAEAAAWVERKAAELADHTLLLGTVMPPETALGLGIMAGQDRRTGWPSHLWPLLIRERPNVFTMPRLNLGTAPPGRSP